MMNNSFDFRVKGGTEAECLANIEKNVVARRNIVFNAHDQKFTFTGGPVVINLTTPGLNYEIDPVAYYKSMNNPGTHIGCNFATTIVFYAGIGHFGPDYSGRRAATEAEMVPGDWAYIYNDANKTNYNDAHHIEPSQDPNWAPGLEGENILYVGGSMKKFWGVISEKPIVVAKPLRGGQGWFDDINTAWKSIDKKQAGEARLRDTVDYPTVGLESP